MEGTKTLRQPDDLSRVNLGEDWEIEWWTAHFETTPDELRAVHQRVGPSAAEIRRELQVAAKKAFQNTGED